MTSPQVWTVIFGAAYTIWIVNGDLHLLASMASSFIWLLLTSVLWVMPALVHYRGCRANNGTRVPRPEFWTRPEQAEAAQGRLRSPGKFLRFASCPSDHEAPQVPPVLDSRGHSVDRVWALPYHLPQYHPLDICQQNQSRKFFSPLPCVGIQTKRVLPQRNSYYGV